ncbi:MAG: hypothetical protein HQM13_09325 [SAR324 cluster bacterium]|nr:hypothetical protein [SAR324 cluster bacterium]
MKWIVQHCILFLVFLGIGVALTGLANAENTDLEIPVKNEASSQKSMRERSLEAQGVVAVPDPNFISEGSSARIQGVYFGVGFRQLRLDFRSGRSTVNNDGAINGVVFNLGHFTEARVWEYSRHVTILDLGENLEFKDRQFNFLEVIQNNLWYLRSIKMLKDLYLNYGLGVQTSEIRLILKAPNDSLETTAPAQEDSTELRREDSLVWGGGASFFITPDFFIQYRFTQANYSPLLTGPSVDNSLHATQIHTLFLQYYFSL